MGALDGRLVVVTGGTRGIGRGVVERFLAEGADVVTTARSAASGAELLRAHPEVTFVVADASKASDLAKLADGIGAAGRKIDAVVANVGGGPSTFVETSTEADVDAVLAVNVKSAFFTVQKLLPHMKDGAAVALVGSIAGYEGGVGAIAYNASKAAVRSFARSMSAELKPRGIRVNVVSPGPTETEGFDVFIGGSAETRAAIAERVVTDRIAAPADVAAVALFLVSDESKFLAGSEVIVDGGFSQT
jgi:NAD(P)-dependent dehydrogenase (short-subunit alcohol dehydrogenase family)